jgi:outer membrane protein TolC
MMMLFTMLFINLNSWSLSENELRQSVLKHLPLIEEASFKYEAARGEETSAEGAFDHKIVFKSRNRIENKYDNQYFETTIERATPLNGLGLVAGHRQGLGHFPAYDGKYQTSSAGEIFAGLTLPLLRNFSIDENRSELKSKKIDTEIAKEQLLLKKNLYLHKSLSLYYKLILESKKIIIRRGILELAEKRQEMLEKRYQAGDLEKIKLVDNQRSIDKRRDELLKTEIDFNKIKMELGLYVRDENGLPRSDFEISDFNTQKQLVSPKRVSLEKVPQIKILNHELEKLQIQQKLFDQSKLPGLNIELLGAREMSGNLPYDPQSLQVGFKFDLPIENRKAEGKSVATLYKLKAIERQRIFTQQELNRFYDISLKSIDIGISRWEIINREFQNTLLMANAEKKKWLQGAADLFIVNLREQDTADADVRRWTTLYDYLQSTLDAKLYSASLMD